MRHYKLTADQIAATGFTDLYVVIPGDWSNTTDDLLTNVALDTLQLGDVVRNHTVAQIKKILAPQPSANGTITISVGRTGTGYTDCLGAFTVMNSGTAVAVETAAAAGETIADAVIASANTVLYAQIDIADADGDLATVTAGELWVWAYISRTAERGSLGDA
jgi:hypothetical protein